MADPDFKLEEYFYAHRGLWTPNGVPENSMAAFEAAARSGFGIELDVRLTKDGVPIVFHDDTLSRMTGVNGLVADTVLSDVTALTLIDGKSSIPTLAEVLDMWPADLPILLEMKTYAESADETAVAVQNALSPGAKRIGIKSFEPKAVASISADFYRGLLIEPKMLTGEAAFEAKLSKGCDELHVDFLSVWFHDAAETKSLITGQDLAAWTLKSEDDFKLCAQTTLAQIFEGFDPRAVATSK